MMNVKIGDKVKVKPYASVDPKLHNLEGVVDNILDSKYALWPVAVKLQHPVTTLTATLFFDAQELDVLATTVDVSDQVAQESPQEPASDSFMQEDERLSDSRGDEVAQALLEAGHDDRVDVTIAYIETLVNVYHEMFHRTEDDPDERVPQIYALMHDELLVAFRMLSQYKADQGDTDTE